MRIAKSKTVAGILSEDGVVEVREIDLDTLESIAELFVKYWGDKDENFSFFQLIKEFKEKICLISSVKEEETGKLTLSEVRAIFEVFKEVNPDFLLILEFIGLQIPTGAEVQEKIKSEVTKSEVSTKNSTELLPNQKEQSDQQSDKSERIEPSSAGKNPAEFLAEKKKMGMATANTN